MADDIERLLAELSEAPGPSGFEGGIRSVVRRELAALVDDLETDGLGSLIARLGDAEARPRVMLSAHMDELGLMVRRITSDGYLMFQPLGGWLDQALVNQRWRVLTSRGEVLGVTGIKTVHVMKPDERERVFKRDGLFIDVGARDRADAEERLGIRPGDPVAPLSPFATFAGGELLLGKAWDDRAGVGVLIEVLRRLQAEPGPNTVYGAVTVQEEVGLRGAGTSANRVAPDIGINLESGVAGDYPGISEEEAQERLGRGPAIFLHDSSMLPNLKLRDLVVEVAGDLGVDLQFNVLTGYGQDGAAMQQAYGGAPVINITVPTRYLHSHNSVIHRGDFLGAVTLVTELVRRLDAVAVEELRRFD
ncbi:MAG: M42 family metallopeptidase [Dehalococcoidia bacterium]